jgi:hypothetical protein
MATKTEWVVVIVQDSNCLVVEEHNVFDCCERKCEVLADTDVARLTGFGNTEPPTALQHRTFYAQSTSHSKPKALCASYVFLAWSVRLNQSRFDCLLNQVRRRVCIAK